MVGGWFLPVTSVPARPCSKTRLRLLVAAFCLMLAVGWLSAQTESITPAEAIRYAGQVKTVCGNVAGTNYAVRTRGQPTFLNLDKPYPNQVFTVLIWGSDRPKFGTPEVDYRDKEICVTGQITVYRGVAEIVAKEGKQISLRSVTR